MVWCQWGYKTLLNKWWLRLLTHTVYPKKYAHGFVVLCFFVVMQSFIMNSHEVSIHIHQGFFAGTGAIVRLPQCQWSKPDGYGKISQCITTTKHSKAKTVCIFLEVYCMRHSTLTNLHFWWWCRNMPSKINQNHYNDVLTGAMASQITSLTIVFSTVYLDTDQRKHQISASLAFVWGTHRRRVNFPHKWPVTRKMFPFDDVIMIWWRHHAITSFSPEDILFFFLFIFHPVIDML